MFVGRSKERCEAAVSDLQKEGLAPKYHHLDIDEQDTIIKLRDFMKEKYDGIDVLVNNAGLAYKVTYFCFQYDIIKIPSIILMTK